MPDFSPQTRGVPLNPNYGGTGSNYSSQSNYAPSYESQRPVSPRPAITVAPPPPVIAAPPPPPSNPPPGSSSHSQHSLERPTSSLSIVSTSGLLFRVLSSVPNFQNPVFPAVLETPSVRGGRLEPLVPGLLPRPGLKIAIGR